MEPMERMDLTLEVPEEANNIETASIEMPLATFSFAAPQADVGGSGASSGEGGTVVDPGKDPFAP